jgi:hypothetical protein
MGVFVSLKRFVAWNSSFVTIVTATKRRDGTGFGLGTTSDFGGMSTKM